MAATVLEVRREGRVAWLTLSRSDAANSFNLELATAVRDRVAELIDDSRCSVVVFVGNSRFFSAGGDVADILSNDPPEPHLRRLADTLHEAMELLAESRLLVVAAVEGSAAGAGFALALNADVVVAATTARFLTAYVGVGLTPDTGMSYLLPRVVGERRARQLLLLGTVIDAEQALDWGIVTEVVPAEGLQSRTAEIAARLADGAQPALAETKRLLNASRTRSFRDQLDDEAATITSMVNTRAAQARLRAFTKSSAGAAEKRTS
ncbi:MAG: hypothetical protein JWN80_2957 [Microbacteriaceae bacterium]|nr:hypothetical protein [Microbacteriaceae bacterium]